MNTSSDVGTAADLLRPLEGLGGVAAGLSRGLPLSGADEFLAGMLASGLEALGQTGRVSAAVGAGLSFIRGNLGDALYSATDYYVYSTLTKIGAEGALDTPGASAGVAAMTGAVYYAHGGSKGIVQSMLCPAEWVVRMLDLVFRIIFARFRRELGDSHLEFAWRRATATVSGMLVLPVAAIAISLTVALYAVTQAGSPTYRMHVGELLGVIGVVGTFLSLHVHFKKFLTLPPELPEVESLADKRRVLWFRVLSIGTFIVVCLIGFALRKAGFAFMQGI